MAAFTEAAAAQTNIDSWAGKAQTIAALFLLILQPLIFFRDVLFAKRNHIPFDLEQFHLPLAASIARSARQGIFPFWSSYSYGGVPIHADIQAQLFYPFTWISLLLGNLSEGRKLYYWLEWQIPFHMILAGVFTFLLLREFGLESPAAFLGGTVYQLGGFFASQAQHLGAISCAAWLPFLSLCVLKLSKRVSLRWIALLAFGVALTLLAGFPAGASIVFIASGMVVLCLAFWRRTNPIFYAALASGFVLGLTFTAVQVVPTYQLAGLSIASLRSSWLIDGGGLPVESLMSLAVPNYYHIFTPFDPAFTIPANFTFLYVYCGILTLALVLLAFFAGTQARSFAILSVVAAVWMLGGHTPVYRSIYQSLPSGIRSFLYSEYALMAFTFFMALSAALALPQIGTWLGKAGLPNAGPAPRAAIWAMALFSAADLLYFGANRPMNSSAGSYKSVLSEYEFSGYPAGSLHKVGELTGVARPPLRVDYLDTDLWPYTNDAELNRIPTMDGNNPFMPMRIFRLRQSFCDGKPWDRELPIRKWDSPLVRMMNVGYLGGHAPNSRETLAKSGWPHMADIAGMDLFRVPNVLPRFFLTPKVHFVKTPEEARRHLERPEFVPEQEAVVEAPELIAKAEAGGLSGGEVIVERYEPNRIDLRVETLGRAFMASSEPMYPGWSATLNGQPANLEMTNGAFRGLWLGPGTNRVSMRYWPTHFAVWISLSVISLVLAAGGALFGATRSFNP